MIANIRSSIGNHSELMKVANNFAIAWTQQQHQPSDSKLAEFFRNVARVRNNSNL
jgi:hypothetical protein